MSRTKLQGKQCSRSINGQRHSWPSGMNPSHDTGILSLTAKLWAVKHAVLLVDMS